MVQEQMAAIRSHYANMTGTTLSVWSGQADQGRLLDQNPRALLGVSSGAFFQPTGFVDPVHRRLISLAATDSLLDVVPRSSLHFTFLALSPDIFETVDELPHAFSSLQAIFADTVPAFSYRLTDLRLVPLPNCLLLAGVPDGQSLAVRQRLSDSLLESPWGEYLEARYRGFQIPPVIWHTTLARYGAERFPMVLRDLYAAHESEKIAALDLGRPELAVINYNWTVYTPMLSGEPIASGRKRTLDGVDR